MSIKLEMQVSIEDIEKALSEADKPNTNSKNKLMREKSSITLQKQICDNIKTKVAKSMTMKLVQEERYDDNSIVLTINL